MSPARASHRLAFLLAALVAASPSAARAQSGANATVDRTPERSIVVGRATGTTVPAVVADIFGPPSYAANYGAVREGVDLSGVALLAMYSPSDDFLGTCTGSLLWARRDILTAAHCVSPAVIGSALGRVDVLFLGPGNVFQAISTTQYRVAAGYDPTYVVNDHDLAVLRLPTLAPSFAASYSLFSGNPLSQRTLFAGFGLCGNGLTGDVFDCGGNRLAGVNQFDAYAERCLDPITGEETCIGLTTDPTPILVTDFDDGSAQNNTLCDILGVCNAGLDREVVTGHGDSGSGNFINGRIAAVTSWGTDGRFGALQGYVSVTDADNRAFIVASAVPEPSTYALFATGLVALGLVARRRRRA